MYLFCYAFVCVHYSFAIILKRNRKLVALLLLSYMCIVTINVLWLLLTVPWVGLQRLIVVVPGHTHLHFGLKLCFRIKCRIYNSCDFKIGGCIRILVAARQF